jgi:ribosomal protein L37AE/L43A
VNVAFLGRVPPPTNPTPSDAIVIMITGVPDPMPTSKRAAQTTSDQTDYLRPYTFHGVQISIKNKHGVGDCPFCGKEKFSVSVDNGLWRCLVCGAGNGNGGGNALTFIRLIHEFSMRSTRNDPAAIASDRKLLDPTTVVAWGACMSIVDQTWLVPGYSVDGKLDQLYRRVRIDGKWCLLPTPGLWPDGKVHALHMPVGDFDPTRPNMDVMEGPWDGQAYWEVAKKPDTNIIGVPGCNVWRDEWSEMCRGKNVTLWFDNDHPVPAALAQGRTVRPGLDGMCRVAKRLSGIAASVRFIRWGVDGYDPAKPTGWDVRDHLSSATNRRIALDELLAKVEVVPEDWFTPHHLNGSSTTHSNSPNVEPRSCHTWLECEAGWADALEWRSGLSDVLLCMLATAASTPQAGDNQLFLDVIGDPGSAKTRLCKGLLVSSKCKLILHLKSFHSGFKGEDGKDVSMVSRINGLCLITPEADALSIGQSWDQLNSQMRQIFDGDTGHTYGNSSEDTHYKGIRSPWIRAGTPALMDKDQSRLGDRFLRIRIETPTEGTKQAILLRALRNERAAVVETSNGTEVSIIPPKLRKAYSLTGGYVDWLRANIEEKIGQVQMDEAAELRCIDLAVITADMRARPNMDPKKHEVHHTKELPSRLVGQFGRLALCLTVVMNKESVDAEVLRIVRRVALDTAHGHSLNIAQWLCSPNPKASGKSYQECGGFMPEILATWSGMTTERLNSYLMFLRKIDVVNFNTVRQTSGSWSLTERVYDLYLKVMGA